MYRSKAHNTNAFQFTPDKQQKYPDWFLQRVIVGKASVTINDKEQYITVHSDFHNERAGPGWWVCQSPIGKLFVLSDDDFNFLYEEVTDGEAVKVQEDTTKQVSYS
jgi:hypothetical protein